MVVFVSSLKPVSSADYRFQPLVEEADTDLETTVTDTEAFVDRSDESGSDDSLAHGWLPVKVLEQYADIATRHGRVSLLDDETWYADVVFLQGVWGEGTNPDEALADLQESIYEWLVVKLRAGDDDIPAVGGIFLRTR